jgi:hypothetical protein
MVLSERRSVPHLDRILTHAVSYALLGSLAGCGGDATPTGNPDGDASPAATNSALTRLPCPPDGDSQFAHMQLALEHDYLAMHLLYTGETMSQVVDELGVACATATSNAACLQALDEALPTQWTRCGQICIAYGVVMTRADEVRLFDNADELRELLGAIDTPYEAALLARAKGYTASCEDLRYRATDDGFTLVTAEMVAECPVQFADVTLAVSNSGEVVETGSTGVTREGTGACVGRRPQGLVKLGCAQPSGPAVAADAEKIAVGRFFSDVAQLEESAVAAFHVIEQELEAHEAPQGLRRAARRAASDEVRHAAITGRLARRYGVEPEHPTIEGRAIRSLFDFAIENVIEGCVRETYGAACARYQALRSADGEVRAALRGVANDEARHAELSWRIHGWACSKLGADERGRLKGAARAAIAELRDEVGRDPGAAVRRFAGMPSPPHALALLDALDAELWTSGQLNPSVTPLHRPRRPRGAPAL